LRTFRLPVLLLAFAAAASAAACTSAKDGESETIDDESQLLEVVNENRRLEAELAESERRLVEDCLEEQGFTVHDELELLTRWYVAEQEALVEDYPSNFLPDPEVAAEWGFGQWVYSAEGWASGAGEEFNDTVGADIPALDLDNSAFDGLSVVEKHDWYTAYAGEEYAASIGSFSSPTEEDEATGGSDDGSIVIDPDLQEAVAPGGCLLEMVDALYGEAEPVAATGGAVGTVWSWGPRSPQEEADWDALRESYRAAVIEPETAFLDCVAAGGWGDWEFDSAGRLPVSAYFNQIYYPDSEITVVEDGLVVEPGSVPEPPTDLPGDLEGQKAHEIGMAEAFLDCAETTGYREDAEAAYRQVQLDLFLSADEELFAYQDDLHAAIDNAQEVIEG
jgi:hypothetical protein